MVQNTVLRRLVIDCHILIGKLMPSRQKRRFPHASDLCLCQGIRINRWTFGFFKFNNVSDGVKIKIRATQEHQLWFYKILASSLLYKQYHLYQQVVVAWLCVNIIFCDCSVVWSLTLAIVKCCGTYAIVSDCSNCTSEQPSHLTVRLWTPTEARSKRPNKLLKLQFAL